MRKSLTAYASRLTGWIATLVLVCMTTGSMKAADPVDLGQIELNKEYTMTSNFSGYVIPTQDGIMNVYQTSCNIALYSSADMSAASEIQGTHGGYGVFPQYWYYNVKAGTTYYFKSAYAYNPATFTFAMEVADNFSLERTSPEQGSVLSLTNAYPFIDVYFSSQVKSISGCTLSCNGSTVSVPAAPNTSTLQINYQSAVQNLVNANVAAGSEITINITGLTNVSGSLYNGDGKLSLSYKLPAKAVTLVSSEIPEVFKSYWPKGDADAICKFNFSGPLSTTMGASTVSVSFGSAELEGREYYSEDVPFTVEGSTLICDLSGVRRTPDDMVESGTNYGNILLRLSGVKDAEGNYVASTGQGTTGSFMFDYSGSKYQVLQKGAVTAEFTPASGTSLKDATQIEVWISGLNSIRFDGFTLTAEENGQVTVANVPMSDVTISQQEATSAVYTFTIPATIKGKSGVTVTLTGLVGLDGYDHSRDVVAEYDKFVITSADPADGSKMEKFADGTVLTVTTNYAENYPNLYMEYQIIDLNAENPDDAVIKSSYWLTRQSDNSYKATSPADYKLIKGHTYEVRFTAWSDEMSKNYGQPSLGTSSIYWEGLTAPFKFSEITLISITPNPDDVLLTKNDREFIVRFDGSVTLNAETTFIPEGMGMSHAFESIEPYQGSHEVEA